MSGSTHSLEFLYGLIHGNQLGTQAALEFILTVSHGHEVFTEFLGRGILGLYLSSSKGGEIRIGKHLHRYGFLFLKGRPSAHQGINIEL